MRRLLATALLISACNHTEPTPTGADTRLPPIDPPTTQLTWGDAGSAEWTPDGNGILYLFRTTDTIRTDFVGRKETLFTACMGILPRLGGSRRWSSCDVRSTQADSIDEFSTPAIDAQGRLLFAEAVYRLPPPFILPGTPESIVFWMADSADPLGTRRELLRLPRVVGDSVISWLDHPGWIDADHFIVNGYRYVSGGGSGQTFHAPRQLLRGTLTADGATIEAMPGTMNASSWARAANGDILFIRGTWWTIANPVPIAFGYIFLTDSTIWRIPAGGGTPVLAGMAPYRLQSLTCGGNDCLAPNAELNCNPATCTMNTAEHSITCPMVACLPPARTLSWFDATTLQFKLIPGGGSRASGVRLNAAGTEYLYFSGVPSSIFRIPFTRP